MTFFFTQVFDIHTAIVLEPSGPMILYHVDSDEEGKLYQINFWVHGVVIKLLPCFILTVISIWLIREVYSANQHQKKIRVYNACPTSNKMMKRQYKADKRTDRTTKMLVAVLLLFLATELPQGILGLLSGLLGRCFFKRCYDLFGELMDALALLNGAINFVLYCSMSRQFRMTFGQMVWRTHLQRLPQPTASHSDGQHTLVTICDTGSIHTTICFCRATLRINHNMAYNITYYDNNNKLTKKSCFKMLLWFGYTLHRLCFLNIFLLDAFSDIPVAG